MQVGWKMSEVESQIYIGYANPLQLVWSENMVCFMKEKKGWQTHGPTCWIFYSLFFLYFLIYIKNIFNFVKFSKSLTLINILIE